MKKISARTDPIHILGLKPGFIEYVYNTYNYTWNKRQPKNWDNLSRGPLGKHSVNTAWTVQKNDETNWANSLQSRTNGNRVNIFTVYFK